MDIPRLDMLPDESQTQPVVSEDVKPQTLKVEESEDVPQPEATPEPKVVKTPENELLAALKEERSKRKDLENKVKELESSVTSEFLDDDSLSIEGKMLKKQLESVTSKLSLLEKEREEERVLVQFPQLKDKAEEFETFRTEYPTVPYDKVAKLFLVENNLLETTPVRKGLEKPTGGEKKQESSGYSPEDVTRLMQTQPRKFIQMIRSGKLKAEDIK